MLASAVVPVRGNPLMSTGPRTGSSVDLGMVAVPRLDLESVDEPLPEEPDHGGVGRRAQIGVALEALEQHVEALAEVAGTEVVEARRLLRFGQQHVAARVAIHQLLRMRSG